jgi:hypothetical protein
MNQLAKLIIARYSALTITEYFCRRQVDGAAIRLSTLLKQVRRIVQGDCSRVNGTERIEEIGHGDLLRDFPRLPVNHLSERAFQQELVVGNGAEAEFVGQKWMHAVDGNKFFCERVGHSIEVLWGAGDAANDFALTNASKVPVDPLACQPPPVAIHADFKGGIVKDSRSPIDGMNLRHEGCVDEPRMIEQVVVGPGWICGTERVAYHVVLSREKRMHQAQADPPVTVDAGDLDSALRVSGEQTIEANLQLAVLA